MEEISSIPFTVNINKVTAALATEFTVKTSVLAEVYRMRALPSSSYQKRLECASTGEYERS